MENLMKGTEAAKSCRVKKPTIRKWAKEGRLPYVRIGREMLFRESDIQAMINKSVVEARSKGVE
jgi:excisionase family DNA binding protein